MSIENGPGNDMTLTLLSAIYIRFCTLPENCQHHDARQQDIVTGVSWK